MSRMGEMMKDLDRENKHSRVRFWIVIAIVLVGLGTAWKLGYVERAIVVVKEQLEQVQEKVAAQQAADKRAGADVVGTVSRGIRRLFLYLRTEADGFAEFLSATIRVWLCDATRIRMPLWSCCG